MSARDVAFNPDDLEGKSYLPLWLRGAARDIERHSTGPVIRDLRALADLIEAAYDAEVTS